MLKHYNHTSNYILDDAVLSNIKVILAAIGPPLTTGLILALLLYKRKKKVSPGNWLYCAVCAITLGGLSLLEIAKEFRIDIATLVICIFYVYLKMLRLG